MTEIRAFQLLSDRLAGLPIDQALHEGVPAWLDGPLHDWLHGVLVSQGESLARRIVVRLRWEKGGVPSYSFRLELARQMELLFAVDAILQLHPSWDSDDPWEGEAFAGTLDSLAGLLTDAGSLYRIDFNGRCLVRRVDSTVQATVDAAIAAATSTAADHLRTAWVAAYGINPDSDKAYDHAVLALEDLLCPLVCPRNNRATLGVVIRDLRSQAGQWELGIEDTSTGQPAGVDSVIQMLDLLWTGQSRHAGNANSRQQTQPEAEAAIHMAAALTQWLNAGVLHRKT